MKTLAFVLLILSPLSQAQPLAHYTYLKAKQPVKKSIEFKEVQRAYELVKKSTFSPPSPGEFFKSYLRYKMGVEVALNESKLVKNPKIDEQIRDPYLKMAFHEVLYKALAEMKLKKQTQKLDQKASKISARALGKIYAKNPEFNTFFIFVYHPINPSPSQVKEAKTRANKIYSQVIKSKKPFLELVALYSDDKVNGTLNLNRSKAEIFPSVYAQLKTMKNNSISRPIRVPSGYVIAKLNRKVPFSEANQTAIKANYFNERRTAMFNEYFDRLRRDFKLNLVNKNLVETL